MPSRSLTAVQSAPVRGSQSMPMGFLLWPASILPLEAPEAKDGIARYGVVPLFRNFNPRLGHFELLQKKAVYPRFFAILVRATLSPETILQEKKCGRLHG